MRRARRHRALHPDYRPVSQAREEQIVERGQFLLAKGVPAVEHDVAPRRQRVRLNQHGDMIRWRESSPAEPQLFLRPAQRQLWQHLVDPAIAAGVAEQDEMTALHVLFGDVTVILDWQLAPEIAMPLVREALEARLGPRLHSTVPGRARAADAQERGVERIVDGALQTGTLAVERHHVHLAKIHPTAIALADDGLAR